MSAEYDLHLTCCCGAALRFASRYAGNVEIERKAFNVQHADCQPLPAVPLSRAMARAVRLAGRR